MTMHPTTHRGDSADAGPEGRALATLLDENWEWRLREYPTLATAVGDPRYDHLWGDASLAAHERRAGELRGFLNRARAIPAGRLDTAARLNHELFLYEMDLAVAGLRFRDEMMPLSQMSGVHQDVADIVQISPRRHLADLQNIEARLRAVGVLVDQTIEAMREGAARGLTPPRAILVPVPDQIAGQIADDPASSPIARLIASDLPEGIDLAARTRQLAAITRAVGEVVTPAFRKLRTFLVDDYLPRCRQSLGLSTLPDGEAWYAHSIRAMTSCDLGPKAIHDLGLSEVARIRGEMLAVVGDTGFKGDLPALLHHLRSDPRFFFDDKEALLMSYRDICKRLDAALPRLFRTLPRLPYGVVPVPEYSEKVQTTAYYYPGSAETGRAGYFYANTYDLAARPKWEMESLTAHEAVPGHHLQIALAQELDGVPAFRRHGHHTAFVEGWGLYAEALGGEMGLYKDPFSKFGRLTYEMWRAVRLVVDTGLHAFGWSRDQAIAYFEAQAGKAGHDIRVEVDRYLAWPGQALAYKLGELKIKELRQRATAALGEAFDLRAFHDAVLLAGALPLPVLERRVDTWIASVVDTATPRAV
ncbi:MAG TPA: DUF885 domain-containing protein [Dongiaceae bacterium]|nr:DUF885 domain-containing protein [Dongiaceae bacterium]